MSAKCLCERSGKKLVSTEERGEIVDGKYVKSVHCRYDDGVKISCPTNSTSVCPEPDSAMTTEAKDTCIAQIPKSQVETKEPSALFSDMFNDLSRWSNFQPNRIYDAADIKEVGFSV